MTFCCCTLLAPDQSFHKFLKLSWWQHFQLCILVRWMPFSTSLTCWHVPLVIHSTNWFIFCKFIMISLFCAVDYFLLSAEPCSHAYRIVPLQLFQTPVFTSALSSTSQPGVRSRFMNIISKRLPKDFTIWKCMRNFIWYNLQFDSKLLIVILRVQTSFALHLCSFYSDQISLSSLWKCWWNRMSKVSLK